MVRLSHHRRRPALILSAAITLSALLLSGCAASSASYPSLAIRDAERVAGLFTADTPPPNAPAEVPLSTKMIERLAQLQTAAASAHRAFLNAAPSATRLVNAASGASIASDGWAEAQIALADLDSARSQAAIPLADLDLLHADAALSLEEREEIIETRNAVTGMITEEDKILSNLRGKMR